MPKIGDRIRFHQLILQLQVLLNTEGKELVKTYPVPN
jgi:hypothetical protein